MLDPEKVLLGLKHHADGCCFDDDNDPGCPYWEDTYCGMHLTADALALLQAMVPRVMTLEEIQQLPRHSVVYLEDRDKAEVIPAILKGRPRWHHIEQPVTDFICANGYIYVSADDTDYLIRWRAWTSCPTDAQRKEAGWNADYDGQEAAE